MILLHDTTHYGQPKAFHRTQKTFFMGIAEVRSWFKIIDRVLVV
jgi:hypothetical protein